MSFDEHHLKMENAQLREEVQRLSRMIANYGVGNYGEQPRMVREVYGGGGRDHPMSLPVALNLEKLMVLELAVAAMEELTKLALAGSPLWVSRNNQYGTEILNEYEYFRTFPGGIGPKLLGYSSEASRYSAVIIMNHINLIEILMDVKQWSKVFYGIVSRAMTLEVLSPGVNGNYNGALQVISAELQVPSPFVPTRKAYFARYCKQHPDESWTVVDVSLDNIRPNAISTCRRRPSGCLIQKSPNGYTKVTWIEHVEVDYGLVHNLYKHVVSSGLAFGAARWVASLERQCQRLAHTMTTIIPTMDRGVITNPERRQGILKLAERMMMSFCIGVGSCISEDVWSALSPPYDGVRITSRTCMNDPGTPVGLVLNVATSFSLPVSPIKVFNFLRDAKLRSQWDVLCKTGLVQEKAHIAYGREPENCITLIQVNQFLSGNHNMFILQESCTDSTGSYVVYAPIGIDPMNAMLSGGDPDCIGLLPSGFAILPSGPNLSSSPFEGTVLDIGSRDSLITVAFQILVDNKPTASISPNSVTSVKSFLKFAVERIKNAVMSDVNTHFPSLQILRQ